MLYEVITVKLGQSTSSLSGGESQRLKLASFIATENTENPTMFIFDEPTTVITSYSIHYTKLYENDSPTRRCAPLPGSSGGYPGSSTSTRWRSGGFPAGKTPSPPRARCRRRPAAGSG